MTAERPTTEERLTRENEELQVRLTLAQAWVGLWSRAFDALLTHGINFRKLPEYADDKRLDEAVKLPLLAGRGRILDYIVRLENAILAAARRKAIREIK